MTLVDFNILAVMSRLLGQYITIIYTTSQNVPLYLLILIGIYDYKFNEEERDWAHDCSNINFSANLRLHIAFSSLSLHQHTTRWYHTLPHNTTQ